MTNIWYCPHCAKSDYDIGRCTTTCMYSPPRVVDGKMIHDDPNITTEERYCNGCGQLTVIKRKHGERC